MSSPIPTDRTCQTCAYTHLCKYTRAMEEAQRQLDNMRFVITETDTIEWSNARDFEWLEPIRLRCRYFKRKE